jgi:cytochrome b6-f complex iron-sulfur subunit
MKTMHPNDSNDNLPSCCRSRRQWFHRLGRGLLGVGTCCAAAGGGLWIAATGRFFVPNSTTGKARRFSIGFPEEFPPGLVETRFRDQHGVWIVHAEYRGKMELFALSTVCTHLGCITNWVTSEHMFKCPCHGSGFRIDGTNTQGPAPRPLERYGIARLADGRLEVDKQKVFRQELGQWDDPDSFVRTGSA